ncbi:MAG TPA: hypothetical protein VGN97_17930 [Mesorhizobium sp.]|jgi:hypothetical protein|nr:hypothetical protein [Mesorhizobium sp.]
MSDQSDEFLRRLDTRRVADDLGLEDLGLGEENDATEDPLASGEALDKEAGAGAGPVERDEMSVDDWDGIDPQVGETVSLDDLMAHEAANDNDSLLFDDGDNADQFPDEALPDEGEEAAIGEDLVRRMERGRFGDDTSQSRTDPDEA